MKNVEVIRNGGSKYDGWVKCVMGIGRKLGEGEGFSGRVGGENGLGEYFWRMEEGKLK